MCLCFTKIKDIRYIQDATIFYLSLDVLIVNGFDKGKKNYNPQSL